MSIVETSFRLKRPEAGNNGLAQDPSGCRHIEHRDDSMEEVENDGGLLKVVIKNKRHALLCLVRNGGQTPASWSWKCKEKWCGKQVTGQNILNMLDSQLCPSWREGATDTGTTEQAESRVTEPVNEGREMEEPLGLRTNT